MTGIDVGTLRPVEGSLEDAIGWAWAPLPAEELRARKRPIFFSLAGVEGPWGSQAALGLPAAPLTSQSKLLMWACAFVWAIETERYFMGMIEQLEQQYEAVAALWGKYVDRLKDFKSNVKNDVGALEASSRKTTSSLQKMSVAYSEVLSQLNSREMTTAIQNAERLANALERLRATGHAAMKFDFTEAGGPELPHEL